MRYRPVQVPNEITVALMTPSIHVGSKTFQEADDTEEFFVLELSKAAIKHDPRTPYYN